MMKGPQKFDPESRQGNIERRRELLANGSRRAGARGEGVRGVWFHHDDAPGESGLCGEEMRRGRAHRRAPGDDDVYHGRIVPQPTRLVNHQLSFSAPLSSTPLPRLLHRYRD